MPSTITDRAYGENSSLAVKAPVVAVASANISLSGLGAITTPVGSYTPADGDRILAIAQTDNTTNGIWTASDTAWQRAGDFDGAYDVTQGTVVVAYLANGQTIFYQLTTLDPIIGTSGLTFTPIWQSNQNVPQTPVEAAAGVVPVNTGYQPGDVRRYGNIGTGLDDTAALQNWLKVGGELTAPATLTALVSAVLNLASNTTIRASTGFVIKQKNAAAIAGAIVYGNAVQNVTIECLTIDGNAGDATNAGALTYGVTFTGGTNNHTRKCYIHDTTQAGLQFAMETNSSEEDSWLQNCGRNIGTDNHGLMAISNTATPLTNFKCTGTIATGAYRKGITLYALTPGTVVGAEISDCIATNCGLGGIYTGIGTAATASMSRVKINNNIAYGSYVNIEVGNCTAPEILGNHTSNDTGGGNVVCIDLAGGVVSKNVSLSSQVAGIRFGTSYLTNNTDLVVDGNVALFSNRSGAGYAPGIDLTNVQYSSCQNNVTDDTAGAAKQTYGVSESGTSDYNVIKNNMAANAVTSLVHIVGAHTTWSQPVAGNDGVGTQSPQVGLDVATSFALHEQVLALVNGANNNVALPSGATTLTVTAPTAAYNITGIAGGTPGRKIAILNYTSQTMTVNYNNAGSAAGNKILIGGSADLAISGFGAVELTWSASANAWIVTGYKA